MCFGTAFAEWNDKDVPPYPPGWKCGGDGTVSPVGGFANG